MRVKEIDWETDGVEVELPTAVTVPSDLEEDEIADYLSDQYGWLVNGFVMEAESFGADSSVYIESKDYSNEIVEKLNPILRNKIGKTFILMNTDDDSWMFRLTDVDENLDDDFIEYGWEEEVYAPHKNNHRYVGFDWKEQGFNCFHSHRPFRSDALYGFNIPLANAGYEMKRMDKIDPSEYKLVKMENLGAESFGAEMKLPKLTQNQMDFLKYKTRWFMAYSAYARGQSDGYWSPEDWKDGKAEQCFTVTSDGWGNDNIARRTLKSLLEKKVLYATKTNYFDYDGRIRKSPAQQVNENPDLVSELTSVCLGLTPIGVEIIKREFARQVKDVVAWRIELTLEDGQTAYLSDMPDDIAQSIDDHIEDVKWDIKGEQFGAEERMFIVKEYPHTITKEQHDEIIKLLDENDPNENIYYVRYGDTMRIITPHGPLKASFLPTFSAESDQFPSMHYGDHDSDTKEKYQEFVEEWDGDDEPPSIEEWIEELDEYDRRLQEYEGTEEYQRAMDEMWNEDSFGAELESGEAALRIVVSEGQLSVYHDASNHLLMRRPIYAGEWDKIMASLNAAESFGAELLGYPHSMSDRQKHRIRKLGGRIDKAMTRSEASKYIKSLMAMPLHAESTDCSVCEGWGWNEELDMVCDADGCIGGWVVPKKPSLLERGLELGAGMGMGMAGVAILFGLVGGTVGFAAETRKKRRD